MSELIISYENIRISLKISSRKMELYIDLNAKLTCLCKSILKPSQY